MEFLSFSQELDLPLKKGFKVEIRVFAEKLHQNKLIGCTELDLESYKIGSDNLVSISSRIKKDAIMSINLRLDDLSLPKNEKLTENYF